MNSEVEEDKRPVHHPQDTSTRGFDMSDPLSESIFHIERYVLGIIGINEYVHLPRLSNAVNDAKGVQKLFEEKYGAVLATPPLLDTSANKENITHLVEDELRATLKPDDALIFFFAGHGVTRIDHVGSHKIETGYLVPVDAQKDHYSQYIKLDSLLEEIGKLPARHILVILDACHSGFAIGEAMKSFRDIDTYQQDLLTRLSRKIITSARSDQLAQDNGPVAHHSLFTGVLIDGLNWGKADLDRNGVITSSEMGLYIQQEVAQYTESQQTPDFGAFHLDDRGELVLSLSDQSFDSLKARAFNSLMNGNWEEFEMLEHKIQQMDSEAPEAKYLSYRLALNTFDQHTMLQSLQDLDRLPFDKGRIPIDPFELRNVFAQAKYFKDFFSIPPSGNHIHVELIKVDKETKEEDLVPNISKTTLEVYPITSGELYCFDIKNSHSEPIFVYFLEIHATGKLSIVHLWSLKNRSIKESGLPSGERAKSNVFRITGEKGLYEGRFFYSSQQIWSFENPPSSGSRAAFFNEEEIDLKRVGMTRIFYEIP